MHKNIQAIWQKTYSTLYQRTFFLIQLKLQVFRDEKTNVTRNQFFFLRWVKKIAETGENAGNQHFLLFPQCFQTILFSGRERSGLCFTSSFSHSVFKRLVSQGCQKVSLCGNGLTNFSLLRFQSCFPNLFYI